MKDYRAKFERLYMPEPNSGCWLWTAYIDPYRRYGVFSNNGGNTAAHRFSWELYRGPIPKGMFVCHRCDNPPCVNPDHLFLGTSADNSRDMKMKRRSPRGERHYASKVTDAERVSAIKLRLSGTMTCNEVAKLYGVSRRSVYEWLNFRYDLVERAIAEPLTEFAISPAMRAEDDNGKEDDHANG